MSAKRKGKVQLPVNAPTLVIDNETTHSPSRTEDVAEIKLHVKMDALTFRYIGMLREILRTSSDQEVFRRALMAYELFEVDGITRQNKHQNETVGNVKAFQKDKYINLMPWMKSILDEAKEKKIRVIQKLSVIH